MPFVALVLVVLIFVAFWPAVHNGFIENWDDEENFISNYGFRGLGFSQFLWAWNATVLGVYQPLAWLICSVEYAIWGLDPWGYHFTSIVLHALNAVVLLALTLTILARCLPNPAPGDLWSRPLAAGVAVALFAAHPLRVEVVAWASCQHYLPCAFFYLLSILAYLRAHEPGKPRHERWLNASLSLFIAALLCKAVAVTLPAVLVVLDVYPLRRLGGGRGRWLGREVRAVWGEKVRFLVAGFVFIIIAIEARGRAGHLVSLKRAGLESRLVQASYGVCLYLVKTVAPLNLMAYYPIPDRFRAVDGLALSKPLFFASTVGVVALSAALWAMRRRWPGLLAAWVSYLVILGPNLGVVRVGLQVAADRYTYVSSMGLVIALAAGLNLLYQRWHARPFARAGLTAAALAAIAVLLPLTRQQCRTWHDSLSVWSHALEHGGQECVEVHINLGAALGKRGRPEEAAAHFARAARLDPGSREAHNDLGASLIQQERYEEALIELREAVRLDPTHAGSHNNLGAALKHLGRYGEALEEFAEAARVNPNFYEARVNLSMELARQGRLTEAIMEITEALRIRPDDEQSHRILAALEARQRQQ